MNLFTIKTYKYRDAWYMATGVDNLGRALSGSGVTARDALLDALHEYARFAHK